MHYLLPSMYYPDKSDWQQSFKALFQVSVFHPYFIYIDQYLEIMPQVCNLSLKKLVHLFVLVSGQFPSYLSISFQSIQSVLVTSAFMMVVSFILIPNPVCSLWVAFSIMSIEVGGLMMLMMMTMIVLMFTMIEIYC